MKNTLFVLFVLIAFASCKDEPKPDPVPVTVYEEWELLPDSVIRSSEDIISIEFRGDRVHIQTANSYFGLDTNLRLIEKFPMGCESTSFDLWAPKYSNEYAIFRNKQNGLSIFDLQQPSNNDVTFKTSENYFGQDVFVWQHSEITSNKEFSTIAMIREGEYVYTILQNFTILHTSNSGSPISLEETEKVVLDSVKSEGWPVAYLKIYRNDLYALCNLNRDFVVLEGEDIISQHAYYFRNMIEYEGALYAGGDSMEHLASGMANWTEGLYVSNDKGRTWAMAIEDEKASLFNAQFEVLDELLITYGEGGDYYFSILNPTTGELKSIDLAGLEQGIRSIEKVGDTVLVGTRAGIYFKSWDSFLNK